MTALRKAQVQPKVTLRRRTRDEALPVRSYYGDHHTIVAAAYTDTVAKHDQTLKDLAKV
ncbi:MAG: hypothetical protein ABN479_19670 [Billgrantia sp.]